jgi:hypothetical protein
MPMDRDTRRIVRTALILLASIMLLLGAAMLVMTLMLHPAPGQAIDHTGAILGIIAYALIATACFYAAWRLRPGSP